jgi:hypothetical protein
VLPVALKQNVGVQIMFAVRKALGNPENLKPFVDALIDSGEIEASEIDRGNPLGFALAHGTLPDVAYRLCRDERGVHVVLSGTGNANHLQQNLDTFERGALPSATMGQLHHLFRNVVSTTGQSLD